MPMNTATIQTVRLATGTQEWAASNVNIQDGCEHDCLYCYAKTMAIRFKRATPASWKRPQFRQHDLDRGFTRRSGRIMFPTAHDITDQNIDECLAVLGRMLAAGNDLLIVSKPRLSCAKRLCEELAQYRAQIVFRFSIGSTQDAILSYWEPGAPSFKARLACLQYAYAMEFQTSVSGEPMLDGDPDALIAAVRPFVSDSIWLGKINRLRQILPFNCPRNAEAGRRGEALMALQSDNAIRALYTRYRRDPKIKWKDSIKAVIGLRRPTTAGMDL
ncbi:MAG: radical SAM protein [candidate division NC10 bacterium]|nr:radical SAM protein [candidate division NC10 bacterium]